ncbi:hypothetical protein [Allobranchiibius sp. GilTou73]|uniref:hypothetical protein n=1 Tax=Allobranchiibius sp. GilTou73 TaxID=2904523 RepID=UPI001F18B763|nr:hypothetical protein [Allobranchiibius sp. GilTou73]UIJ35582.1 hypothetical protein LVQ62_04120 [Allobranchiibius sp. GilTou73]
MVEQERVDGQALGESERRPARGGDGGHPSEDAQGHADDGDGAREAESSRSTYGTGGLDPDRIVPASDRSTTARLRAIADLREPDARLPRVDATLGRELTAWAADRAGDDP